MKQLAGMIVMTASLALVAPQSITAAGKQARAAGETLLGTWHCSDDSGTVQLVFESANRLVFKGDPVEYRLVPGAIRVRGDYGPVDYAYSLKGDKLSVAFPDGSRMQCLRAAGGGKSGAVGGKSGDAAADGHNHQLRGMLCSWSGSSTSGSSYSRSTRVSFDGRGGFRYGSESSFSSGAGQAYGQGGGNQGTYRVSGNTVHLSFTDGSSAVAQVKMRQNSGMITELMYNGTLYATGLCD